MKNIIIVTKGTATARVSYDDTAMKVAMKDFEPIVGTEVAAATRINALNAVVISMAQISEIGELDEPVGIYTIKMVTDMVKNGTPLYWLKNGGKRLNGEEIAPEELELWKKFYALYANLVTDVIFKDVTAAVNYVKNSKFPVSQSQRTIADYIGKAWDNVTAKANTIEEIESDGI